MSEFITKTMTIRELANYCGCSKIPIKKQIQRLGLDNITIIQGGKKVKAYELTKNQLSSIRDAIYENKGKKYIDNSSANVTDNANSNSEIEKISQDTKYGRLLDEYIKIKSLYDVAVTTQNLLEFRQGENLTKLNELQNEKENLIKEKATLQADLRNKDKDYQRLETNTDNRLKNYRISLIGVCIVCIILLLMLLGVMILK